jgi:predicted N-acetyltransferase YhbS
VTVDFLADHVDAIPRLARWFFDEWADHYAERGLRGAEEDLRGCCRRAALPLALVALDEGEVAGTVALKADTTVTEAQPGPWLSALLVDPGRRGRGVGRMLIESAESRARELGIPMLFTATATAEGLFVRLGWIPVETIRYLGQDAAILRREIGDRVDGR